MWKNSLGIYPQYFKGKKLQSEIFTQLNIKKIKLTDNFLKKNAKTKNKKKNTVVIYSALRMDKQWIPTHTLAYYLIHSDIIIKSPVVT
jgi:hypothetical protein